MNHIMTSRYTYPAALALCILTPCLHSAESLNLTSTGDAWITIHADSNNTDEAANSHIYLTQDGQTNTSLIGFVGPAGASQRATIPYAGTLADSLFMGSLTTNALQLGTNSITRLTITSGGNVGIGTNAATSKLHLYDTTEPTLKIESAADGLPTLQFIEASSTKWSVLNNTSDRLVFKSTVSGVSTDRLVLDPAGNVGIGTGTPSHKLSVNGAVRAKEIIVDTNWADDVFAADYRLAPLSEVEQHIKAKGHLPSVPSAAEVAEKGISVGESQAMLLRKVEELTLHVIALNKRLQELETQRAENTHKTLISQN